MGSTCTKEESGVDECQRAGRVDSPTATTKFTSRALPMSIPKSLQRQQQTDPTSALDKTTSFPFPLAVSAQASEPCEQLMALQATASASSPTMSPRRPAKKIVGAASRSGSGGMTTTGSGFRSVVDIHALPPISDDVQTASANPLISPHALRPQLKKSSGGSLSSPRGFLSDEGDDDPAGGLLTLESAWESDVESVDGEGAVGSGLFFLRGASLMESVTSRASYRSESSVTFESHVVRLGAPPPTAIRRANSNGLVKRRRQSCHGAAGKSNNGGAAGSATSGSVAPVDDGLECLERSHPQSPSRAGADPQNSSSLSFTITADAPRPSYRALDLQRVQGGSACLVPL